MATRYKRAIRCVAYADDLPEEAEDQVRLSGLQVFRSDVDDVAADRLSRVECQRQVLVYPIDVQLAAVQRPLINRTWLRTVHHLTVIHSRTQSLHHRSIYTINLREAVTLGRYYDKGGASPVRLQGHAICYSGR